MNAEDDKQISGERLEDTETSLAESQTEVQSDNTPGLQQKAPGHRLIFDSIVLVLICGLIGGGYHLWNELQKAKTDLADIVNTGQTQTRLTTGSIATLNDAIKRLEQKQIEQADAMASLYRDKQGSNEDWAIAEIEYLLIIAMHRLLLEEDAITALAAMQAADLRLKDLKDPGLLPIRQQLAKDINQLGSVNQIDIAGIAIYLADMVILSDDLPLKPEILIGKKNQTSSDTSVSDAHASDSSEPIWKKLPKLLWQEIKGLIVIKRTGEIKQALLLPGEEYFLYQNLRLELESARLAVLRADTKNLRVSIDLIQSWLQLYFDTSDSAVINVIETLDQMQSVELKPVLPDISSSLESLRAYLRETAAETDSSDEIQ